MEIAKAYDPKEYESEIYKLWEESGAFTPKIEEDKQPFVISMPPPNVTGKLHIGHALFITLQDIMVRYHRMLGEPTLWLPGTDHAGIATQTVVDKALRKKDISRFEIGREKFVEEVWKWKEQYGGEITNQLRHMGASCDWSRERFTLDEGLSEAVNVAFKRFYDKGLIYRGEYIVNWCPKCATAIADDEVEHTPQKAKLYFFTYDKNFPITIATTRPETKLGDTGVAVNPSDSRYKEYIGKQYEIDLDGVKRTVKIFADRSIDKDFGTGAVGVTPAHSMADWKMAEDHDLEKIKVINERGKMTEATGEYAGMKVVEAREKLLDYLRNQGLLVKEEDFENNLSICYRCGGAIEPLPSLQWFVKMKPLAEQAKKAVKSGEIKIVPKRFEKVYFHWMDGIHDWCISRQLWWGHRIPVYYRKQGISNDEFLISNKIQSPNVKTWDLKIYGEDIFAGLKNGSKTVEFRAGRPETDEKYWGKFKTGDKIEFKLADEKTDQIIETEKPLRKTVKKVTHFDNFDDLFELYQPKDDYPGKSKEELKKWWVDRFKERIEKFGVWAIELENCDIDALNENLSNQDIYVGTTPPPDADNWVQDEDVLDTWFSSGLWPFSTLGWPDENASDYKYFYPTTVMETGYDLIFFWVARMIMMGLELTGKPPFKTVYMHGLVRDQQNRKMSKSLGNVLDPLDVADKFGTDAVRMSLIVGTSAGADSKIGESKVQGYRNFSNKIWNIARFVLTNLEEIKTQDTNIKLSKQDEDDLKKLDEIVVKTSKYLDELKFSQAGELLYEYTWHEFADRIIEEAKTRLKDGTDEEKQAAAFKLLKILKTVLVLLHPFVPFVTEAVWKNIPRDEGDQDLLINQRWPSK